MQNSFMYSYLFVMNLEDCWRCRKLDQKWLNITEYWARLARCAGGLLSFASPCKALIGPGRHRQALSGPPLLPARQHNPASQPIYLPSFRMTCHLRKERDFNIEIPKDSAVRDEILYEENNYIADTSIVTIQGKA